MNRHNFNLSSRAKIEILIVSVFILMALILSWSYMRWDEVVIIEAIIAGVVAATLTFSSLRYSWVVLVCAFSSFYVGALYFEAYHVIVTIAGSMLLLGAFSITRWFYKRPTKGTRVYLVVFFISLGCLIPLKKLIRDGSNQSRCIIQMVTYQKLIPSYCGLNGINPGEPFDINMLVEHRYVPSLYICPAGGAYTYTNTSPSGKPGTPAFTQCNYDGHGYDPYPIKTEQEGGGSRDNR